MARVLAVIAAGVAAAVLAAATPALGQGDATPILPPHPTRDHLPFDGTQCETGERGCIVPTLAEMYRRLNAVVPVCDHRAPFALAYLRVTEEWRRRLDDNYFADPAWTEHIDRVFANLYFRAYDSGLWEQSTVARRGDVIPCRIVVRNQSNARLRDVQIYANLAPSTALVNGSVRVETAGSRLRAGGTLVESRYPKVSIDRGHGA